MKINNILLPILRRLRKRVRCLKRVYQMRFVLFAEMEI
jgi:hypothetical protein